MQLFVNNLCTIDSSCLDPEFGIIGKSWIVDIVLDGQLDEQGMVMDFGLVKKEIKKIIDQTLDHSLIVPAASPRVTLNMDESGYIIQYQCDKGYIEHVSPAQAVTVLETDQISITALQDFLEQTILQRLDGYDLSLQITLHEEEIAGASYCYSHGLKQHDGNCQRIAHGHRSQIRIFENNTRLTELENSFATQWHGKYVANHEDIVKRFEKDGIAYITFSYEASQGSFTLTIPQTCCVLINNETTVEYIAQHICTTLCQSTQKSLTVHAYEGVQKGAIASCTSM